MLRVCRTDYLIRVLVVTAMVWGFALPIAHLACGKMMDSEAIPCDDHALMDDANSDAGHAGPEHAGIQTRGHEAPVPHLHNGIASPAHHAYPAHAAVRAVGHDAANYSTEIPLPTAEVETGDVRVECCWVDSNAADRRAPLPTLTQLPDLAAALTGIAPSVDIPEVREIDRTSVAVATPPIAFRLLFSVFLI